VTVQAKIDAARERVQSITDHRERSAAADALAYVIANAIDDWTQRFDLSEDERLGVALNQARAQHSPKQVMTFAEEVAEREADELHRRMFRS
jgi:hypothetical protein